MYLHTRTDDSFMLGVVVPLFGIRDFYGRIGFCFGPCRRLIYGRIIFPIWIGAWIATYLFRFSGSRMMIIA
jgi:hypothetical protein